MVEPLIVRSNVARDVLTTADEFGSVPKMIVEYVSNSLDNPDDPSLPVTVQVSIRRYNRIKTITVGDNGCGMDHDGIREFFVMHRENQQRQRGRRARGRFGTGKSAAFGVGSGLHIDTVRNGRRWAVELTQEELRAAAKANRPPEPRWIVEEQHTDRSNGTTVTITGVAKRARPESIVNELRRRLGRQLERHEVYVEQDRVRLEEPVPEHTWRFPSEDDSTALATLGGGLQCTIHSMPAGVTINEALRGVIITSREHPVAQHHARGDFATRIYGLCEVPALDDDTSTPGPFTDRRDMTLNADNGLAAATVGWVERCLETVTRELQEQDRERRRRARDAELERAASQAEAVLNEHFRTEFKLLAGGGASGGSADTGARSAGLQADENGSQVLPNPDGVAGYAPEVSGGAQAGEPLDELSPLEPEAETSTSLGRPRPRDPLGEGRGEPVSEIEKAQRRRSRGGFTIDYSDNGKEAPRAAYYPSTLTIEINLDHPLLAAVLTDRDLFQGLAFTIAAEEYAQATANDLIDSQELDAFDTLQYERTTMDKLCRAFADVFTTLTAAPK